MSDFDKILQFIENLEEDLALVETQIAICRLDEAFEDFTTLSAFHNTLANTGNYENDDYIVVTYITM